LEEKVKQFLKKDAIVSIGSDGLVGNMIVNITPGKGNAPMIEEGDLLNSYTRIEAGDVMNTLGNTTENLALLTINLLEIAENINTGKGTVSKLINDELVANNLASAVSNMRASTSSLRKISRDLEQNMASVYEGEGALGYLLKDNSLGEKVDQVSVNLDSVIRLRTAPIFKNLEQSTKDLQSSSAALKKIVETIDLEQGLTGTLMNDSMVVKDFKETLENLNEGTEKFSENMDALKSNFLLRKYFKKQEKAEKKAAKSGQ
ncbi:MAG: MCE family protein, partial [Saprospiraceae bacterium]|nr:MCE family protein [Saprospiraceae bacterium]